MAKGSNMMIKEETLGSFNKDEALEKLKEYLCPYDFGKNCGRCMGCELADIGEHPDVYLSGDRNSFPVLEKNHLREGSELPLPTDDAPKLVIINEDRNRGDSFLLIGYTCLSS